MLEVKKVSETILNVALFVTSSLLVKKITPKSNFLYLRFNTSFFLAHVTKYQIYLLYFSLLDQEKLWQTFTTDKYICVIWRKNEQSIIEVCNKIQKLRKSLSFFISYTISRKNWPNIYIFFLDFYSNLSNIWISFAKFNAIYVSNNRGNLISWLKEYLFNLRLYYFLVC